MTKLIKMLEENLNILNLLLWKEEAREIQEWNNPRQTISSLWTKGRLGPPGLGLRRLGQENRTFLKESLVSACSSRVRPLFGCLFWLLKCPLVLSWHSLRIYHWVLAFYPSQIISFMYSAHTWLWAALAFLLSCFCPQCWSWDDGGGGRLKGKDEWATVSTENP